MPSRLAAALVVALALVSGCADQDTESPVSNVVVQDEDGLNGAVLPDPYVASDLALTTTDGSAYSLASDPPQPITLVFFGYTQCPDICQIAMADITSAVSRLDDGAREQVGMVFVTTDPARDDEVVLEEYLSRFDSSYEGLTGRLGDIVEVGESLGVPITKGARLASGGYEVDHGTQIIGLLADGTAPVLWTHGTSPDAMAQDLESILDTGVPDLAPEGDGS